MAEIQTHPAANLFPMLADDRLAELAADIHENGQREPIQILDGKILDGRNRYRACEMAGVTPQFYQVPEGTNPWAFVWSLNGQRRDLSEDQRYIIWKECAENDEAWKAEQKRIADEANKARADAARAQENRGNQYTKKQESGGAATSCGTTSNDRPKKEVKPKTEDKPKTKRGADKKATSANVNRGTVERNDYLQKNRPDLYDKVKAGEMTSSKAKTQAAKDAKLKALDDISAQEVKAAQGVYDVIVMDPPWPMEKIEREVAPNQAAFDYPTMTEAELSKLEVPAAEDCHLWQWTTHKFLPMSLRLLEVWGFKYVCVFTWHKPGGFQPYGLPQYNCEFAIYARKGAPLFIETKAFPVCFSAPRGAHSEKPQDFYDVVKRVTGGRRLDMFNRRLIDGFDGWGNESA